MSCEYLGPLRVGFSRNKKIIVETEKGHKYPKNAWNGAFLLIVLWRGGGDAPPDSPELACMHVTLSSFPLSNLKKSSREKYLYFDH